MKTTTLLSTILLLAVTAAAQITITDADFAGIGKTLLFNNDTLPGVTIAPGGTGSQTWDFSALNNHTNYSVDVVDPAATPYSADYPAANRCFYGGGAYNFVLLSASQAVGLGYAGTFSTFGTQKIKTNPTETLLQLPFTLNNTFNNTYGFDMKDKYVQFGSDSGRYKSVSTKTVLADAYGSLTTPLGTYNTLRVKEVTYTKDTVWLHYSFFGWTNVYETYDSTVTYKWYANGVGIELASMTINQSTGNASSVTWLSSLPLNTGIDQAEALTGVSIYPNPAQHQLMLQAGNGPLKTFEMYDLSGRMVKSVSVNSLSATVPCHDLPNGWYTYKITDLKDRQVQGKIAVCR